MNTQNKLQSLQKLKHAVHKSRPSHLTMIQDFPQLNLDHPVFLTPWTIGAQKVSSNIMLVAQDWLSEDYLLSRSTDELVELRRHGQLSQLPTNRNIGFFLENALNLQFSDTYATNLYPFIKQGAISASIPTRDLNWSIENALLPQIDIVKPETVLILGIGIARLVQKHFKRTRSIEKPFSVGGWWKFGQSTYIALPHPGGRATASFGGKDSVAQLWRTSIERAK